MDENSRKSKVTTRVKDEFHVLLNLQKLRAVVTIVRDRHAMSIAPDVIQYLLGSCERPLGVDHPFGLAQRSQVIQE